MGERSAQRRQQEIRRRLYRQVQAATVILWRADYVAVSLLNSAVTAVNGDLTKKEEMRKAMEKADFKSVRGNFKFGNNHIPIQNFYLQDLVKQGNDYVLKTVATIVENDQDRFHDKCPMKLGE